MQEVSNCPFCFTAISGSYASCDTCQAPHHPECLQENQGCAVLGCTQRMVQPPTTESFPPGSLVPPSAAVSATATPYPANAAPANGTGHQYPPGSYTPAASAYSTQQPYPTGPAAPGSPAQNFPTVSGSQPPSGVNYYPAVAPNDGKAIAAMVCGILGIVGFFFYIGWILGIIAVALGVSAKNRINASSGRLQGLGMAKAGIITGTIAIALTAVLFLLVLIAVSSTGTRY